MKIKISFTTNNGLKVETNALIDSGAKGASFINKNFVKDQ